MDYNGNDIYCDVILTGRLEIKKIKETDNILAFYHSKPHWPTHIVIIPKRHISSIITFEKEDNNIGA